LINKELAVFDNQIRKKEEGMMKFIHISDLHYHRGQQKNRDANNLLKLIKEKYKDSKLIITGDIVDDGHPSQYENAYKALKPFTGNVFIAPGNHDFGAVGNFYSEGKAKRFDEMLALPLDQGGAFKGENAPIVNLVEQGNDKALLIALDTNLETEHPFDFACGEVGSPQLSVLDKIISDPATADMIRILFFHHHPFVRNDPFMELKDAKELMRTIYSKIDVLLFGHKHVSEERKNMNGIKYVLASDNSPGKDWAREITVKGKQVTVKDISIKIGGNKKKTTNK
jgi:3',5'-cyclic AMP phosphodiesterase CpdA